MRARRGVPPRWGVSAVWLRQPARGGPQCPPIGKGAPTRPAAWGGMIAAMPEEPRIGSDSEEAHRRLLQFLRGLSHLDEALGPWRPDYGGLRARPAPQASADVDLAAAHERYAAALRYFADAPEATWSLGETSREDISAAIADARIRFGGPVIPLEALLPSAPPGPATLPLVVEPTPAPVPPADLTRRPPRNALAMVVGLISLLVTGLIVAGVVVAAKAFLGPGPTALPGLAATPPPVSSGAASTSGPLPDVLAPANCPALPTGHLPSALMPSGASSGIAIDPQSGYSTPYVSVTLAQPVSAQSPSLAVVIPVLQYGAGAPNSGGPLDRAGTVQLIAFWDGRHWYAAIRSWSGSSWSAPSDTTTPGIDVSQSARTVTLFWMGLTPGDRYGGVVASGGSCAVVDLSSSLSPTRSYGT